ncbi:MAG: hypothetical protein MJ245_01430 [Clostridia bacterium]|nr:hypothetical protein [Clostridia bacterium]
MFQKLKKRCFVGLLVFVTLFTSLPSMPVMAGGPPPIYFKIDPNGGTLNGSDTITLHTNDKVNYDDILTYVTPPEGKVLDYITMDGETKSNGDSLQGYMQYETFSLVCFWKDDPNYQPPIPLEPAKMTVTITIDNGVCNANQTNTLTNTYEDPYGFSMDMDDVLRDWTFTSGYEFAAIQVDSEYPASSVSIPFEAGTSHNVMIITRQIPEPEKLPMTVTITIDNGVCNANQTNTLTNTYEEPYGFSMDKDAVLRDWTIASGYEFAAIAVDNEYSAGSVSIPFEAGTTHNVTIITEPIKKYTLTFVIDNNVNSYPLEFEEGYSLDLNSYVNYDTDINNQAYSFAYYEVVDSDGTNCYYDKEYDYTVKSDATIYVHKKQVKNIIKLVAGDTGINITNDTICIDVSKENTVLDETFFKNNYSPYPSSTYTTIHGMSLDGTRTDSKSVTIPGSDNLVPNNYTVTLFSDRYVEIRYYGTGDQYKVITNDKDNSCWIDRIPYGETLKLSKDDVANHYTFSEDFYMTGFNFYLSSDITSLNQVLTDEALGTTATTFVITPNVDIKKYNITFDTDGGKMVGLNNQFSAGSGTVFFETLDFFRRYITKDNYTLVGFKIDDSNDVVDHPYIEHVRKDYTIHCVWEANPVNVVYTTTTDCKAKDEDAMTIVKKYNDKITITLDDVKALYDVDQDFEIVGFVDNYNTYKEDEFVTSHTYTLTKELKITPVTDYKHCKVTIDANGGKLNGIDEVNNVKSGVNTYFTVDMMKEYVTRDNYNLVGFMIDDSKDVVLEVNERIRKDCTIHCVWEGKDVNVKYLTSNGMYDAVDSSKMDVTKKYGDTYLVTLNDVKALYDVNEDYQIIGFRDNTRTWAGEEFYVNHTYTLDGDMNIYPVLERKTYKLDIDTDGGVLSNKVDNPLYFESGVMVNYSLDTAKQYVTKDHFELVGFYINGSDKMTDSIYFENFGSDATVKLAWKQVEYKVTLNPGEGAIRNGVTNPFYASKFSVSNIDLATKYAVAPEDYEIDYFMVSTKGDEHFRDLDLGTLTSDVTITVYYKHIKKTITLVADNGIDRDIKKDIDVNSTYVVPKCDFKAPSGKEFSHWVVVPSNEPKKLGLGTPIIPEVDMKLNPGDEIMVKNDVTLKAVWKNIKHPKPDDPKPNDPKPNNNPVPSNNPVNVITSVVLPQTGGALNSWALVLVPAISLIVIGSGILVFILKKGKKEQD